jgi:YVTN family beta-propeller protein
MDISRRTVLKAGALGALSRAAGPDRATAQGASATAIEPADRVFICNEDSNTLGVIDPRTNTFAIPTRSRPG